MKSRMFSFNIEQKKILSALFILLIIQSVSGGLNAFAEMPPGKDILNAGGTLIADIAESRISGVVNISSTRISKGGASQLMNPFFNDPFFREFFGHRFHGIPREKRQRSLGSGVIVSHDGLVLTNNHVVENSEEIIVTLSDKREMEAEIVGADPKSDVAVIRLKGDIKDLNPVPIGNSDKMRLGDIVLAIGNPFGLDHTVTMGIVSAKGRANIGLTDYEDFIQTDAAINPGNSGGALINLKGELVGINTAIMTKTGGYQGVGFAIPSNMAKAIMDSLVKHGKVVRGWLGVAIQDLDKNLAEAMDLKDTSGVLVSDVTENSPAENAGIKRGDVILKVNGEKMPSSGKLRNIIAGLGAGSKVRLNILRNGRKKQISLKLGELPDEAGSREQLHDDDGMLDGISVAPLSKAVRDTYKINRNVKSGVVITDIENGSMAAQAGLRPGDVILEINRMNVNSADDVKTAYKKSKDNLLLLIYRNNNTFFLALKK